MDEPEEILKELPRMQFHTFQPWRSVDAAICRDCGGPEQAHPSAEWLAEHVPPSEQGQGG